MEESVGRDKAAIKLITKVIPNWRHYIRTGFGNSNEYYGGEYDQLAGTGQGNRFSGDVCRDTSCLIIKAIETKDLGMKFKSNISNETISVSAVVYVDDNDLVSDGQRVKEKMQTGLSLFNSLHEATGGCVEESKSKIFSYKWNVRSGRKVIRNMNGSVTLNQENLQVIDCKKQERTLGVMMGPALIWDAQFVTMVNKMKDAIGKLKNTTIAVSTASMYYNMYLIKKVYYGGGVFSITNRQETILKNIYETVILNKMGLSQKFLLKALYARKLALGVGLMSPSTILNILALKLYVSHKRGETEVSKMIRINEENISLYYGFSKSAIDPSLDWKPVINSWSDEIRLMLRSRKLEIVNRINDTKSITMNKTIMDYAMDYSKEIEIIEAINHVRIFKKMIIPCELVGFRGGKETKELREWSLVSSIKWNVEFEEVIKPHKRLVEEWQKFINWLRNQEVDTLIDCISRIETKYEISADKRYVKINEENVKLYESKEWRYGQLIYQEVEQQEGLNFRKTIAEMKPNSSFVIHEIFGLDYGESAEVQVPFNDQITRSIEQGMAVAATDASVKGYGMGGCWIFTDLQKNFKQERMLYHKNWEDNTSGCAEVIVLLELITVLEKKGRHIN